MPFSRRVRSIKGRCLTSWPLSHTRFDDVLARLRDLLDPTPDAAEAERQRLTRALADVDRQIERCADALALTGDVPAIARRLQQAHAHRRELVTAREALGRSPRSCRSIGARWRRRRGGG